MRKSDVQETREYVIRLERLLNEAANERDRLCSARNLLRDALAWFDSHDVETKLGHLPQWVAMARELP